MTNNRPPLGAPLCEFFDIFLMAPYLDLKLKVNAKNGNFSLPTVYQVKVFTGNK